MDSGSPGSRRFSLTAPDTSSVESPSLQTPEPGKRRGGSGRLAASIARTRDYLLSQQAEDGYWLGELEGDTILESEYVLLLAFLGREHSEKAQAAAEYIRRKQLPEGGWAIYPGGPPEVSASVKAYFVLKLTGHDAESDDMVRARRAVLQMGGVERVNSFTRYYLALLGVISYEQCPAVPPELVLLPEWMPFNIYEMSAWSRTILVPLSLLWAHRPVRRLPAERGIGELFVSSPDELSVGMAAGENEELAKSRISLDWDAIFGRIDRLMKLAERWRLRPLRQRAIRRASEWMLERFAGSDGLGAIFPPIIWSVVALKCLEYDDDSPEIRQALGELDKLSIREAGTVRVQPCKSPVWDTALTTLALREAEVPAGHPALQRAADWLLSKEVRRRGDWFRNRRLRSRLAHWQDQAGGWFFEFHNEFYPDVDDTSMVVIALARCLPDRSQDGWSTDFLLDDWSPHEGDRDTAAVVAARHAVPGSTVESIERARPLMGAVRRGARWVMAMQNSDGGWGAFDLDNNRELFTRVPFADHNAMIDPSTPDLTARCLEMFAEIGIPGNHPRVRAGIDYLWRVQEADGSWYGRWGVNYIYGTWQALVGLSKIGVPHDDPRIRRAVEWLKTVQQECGGWGETPGSYNDPALRGQGEPTASQTAWALLGLMAAGEVESDSVQRGISYLLDTQHADGTWSEEAFTGTGFPKVFYLKYHLYRVYFPLMALARYARIHGQPEAPL